MNKKKPGLPDSFDLGISDDDLKPAELGDFLDENLNPRPPAPAPKKEKPRLEIVETDPAPADPPAPQPARQPSLRTEGGQAITREDAPPAPALPERRRSPRRGNQQERKRIEYSIDPLLERQINDILSDVRTQGLESKVTTSELHKAIWQAIYQARNYMDFSSVPRRGQWGAATAQALISEVRDAFLRGITEYGLKNFRRLEDDAGI